MTEKGFIEHNGYKIINVKEGESAELRVDLKEETLNPFGYAHGGLLFGLGDTAMGVVAFSFNRKAVTTNSSITFLRPSKGSFITAKARMIKDGKRICYLRCDFFDEEDTLTATMDGSYYYVDKEN